MVRKMISSRFSHAVHHSSRKVRGLHTEKTRTSDQKANDIAGRNATSMHQEECCATVQMMHARNAQTDVVHIACSPS